MENEQPSRLEKITTIIKTNKWALLLLACALVLGILILILFPKGSSQQQTKTPNKTIPSISPQAVQTQNNDFNVVGTSPSNGEKNIYSGEINIVVKTDKSVMSPNDFSMEITPPLPNYWKFVNTYPTNTITAQIYGGLQTNTTYTVTFTNKKTKTPYSWTFTTSGKQQEDATQIIRDQTENENAKYFPLFDYIPYENSNFSIDYTDKLTLVVSIKNPNVEMVKDEVSNWIRSHNVDPATHTINYQYAY